MTLWYPMVHPCTRRKPPGRSFECCCWPFPGTLFLNVCFSGRRPQRGRETEEVKRSYVRQASKALESSGFAASDGVFCFVESLDLYIHPLCSCMGMPSRALATPPRHGEPVLRPGSERGGGDCSGAAPPEPMLRRDVKRSGGGGGGGLERTHAQVAIALANTHKGCLALGLQIETIACRSDRCGGGTGGVHVVRRCFGALVGVWWDEGQASPWVVERERLSVRASGVGHSTASALAKRRTDGSRRAENSHKRTGRPVWRNIRDQYAIPIWAFPRPHPISCRIRNARS